MKSPTLGMFLKTSTLEAGIGCDFTHSFTYVPSLCEDELQQLHSYVYVEEQKHQGIRVLV